MDARMQAAHQRDLGRAVARAVLAPSVHNTQPWRFVLRETGLEIWADPQRRLAVLDPTGRQQHLSAGCALFNARVSLAESGYATSVHRLPDPAEPGLLARVSIADTGCADAVLAALGPAVERRQTNRRRFDDIGNSSALVDVLVRAAAAERSWLVPVADPRDQRILAGLWQRADDAQQLDPAYRSELRQWTGDQPGRRDGVPARSVPHVDAGSGDEIPIRDFDTAGAGWLPTATGSSRQQCLLLLGSADENPVAWLRAGEALERVWLEITRAGYVASLFTQAIEVARLRTQLAHDLRLPMHPHVLLRVGNAKPTPSTSRRPLREVFSDLTRTAQ